MIASTHVALSLAAGGRRMHSRAACLPMPAGAIAGGWAGARVGRRLPEGAVRAWTLLVTGATAAVFFRHVCS